MPAGPPDMESALQRERELSEMKSRFVALTSHELRTPLAAILSSVELLEDFNGRMPEDEQREVLGLIKSSVLRMNGLVGQVQLMSRLDAGQLGFEPRATDIAGLLGEVAAEAARSYNADGRVAIEAVGLEQPRVADGRLLRSILSSLLDNAIKYSDGKPVTATARAEGSRLVLEVRDHGIGIPEEEIPHLYQPFHRGANAGNIRGTGVGLHIAHRCVELHGGSMAVDSAAGRGTTFRVVLDAPAA